MLDMARLGMEVDSRQVRRADSELKRFAVSGKKASKSAEDVGKSGGIMAAGMKRAAVAATAAVAALASLGTAVRILSQFERQMSKVGAVSRASAKDVQAMRDIAKQLGSTTEFTATQAGQGLEFLARAGFTAKESIAAIPAVLNLSTAAALDMGSAADIASNIMSAFAINADKSASVADILAAASSRSNTDVRQLGDAMAFVGPVASALGISMSDAAAAIGKLSDAGIQGSSAGTGLRRVLSSLANPTKEAATALSNIGVTLDQVDPQVHSIVEIVGTLADAGLSAADALTIFGDRGGPAILALTSQSDDLRTLTSELSNVDGEAKRMATTMRDNLGGDIDSLVSALQGLVLSLGEAGLTAALRDVTQLITAFVRGLTAMVDGVVAVETAVGGFVSKMLGLEGTQVVIQRAIDNTTLAMGDQIDQTQRLAAAQGKANVISLESARVKLFEAQAAQEVLKALQAAAQEQFFADQGLPQLLLQTKRIRDEIETVKQAPALAKEMGVQLTGEMADAESRASKIEQLGQQLARTMIKIEHIRNAARGSNFLTDENAQKLEQLKAEEQALRKGIENTKDGLVKVNGEWVKSVDLSSRLSTIAAGITLSNATASARSLAQELGVNIGLAAKLDATLNRQAGINTTPRPKLSFGESHAGGGPQFQTFTNSGGSLSFSPSSFMSPYEVQTAKAASAALAELSTTQSGAAGSASRLSDAEQLVNRILGDASAKADLAAKAIDILDQKLAAGKIAPEQYADAVKKVKDQLAGSGGGGGSNSLAAYAEDAANIADDINQAFVSAFQGAENAIRQFVMTGKLEFSDLAR